MSDRAVSVTVNYVLGLGVATLLLSGLLVATGGVLEDRQEATVRSELRVVGEQVSANLAIADRLARTDGASTVVVVSPAPDRVAGRDYSIELDAATDSVVLETADGSVTVRVPFAATADVATSRASGGDVEVFLNPAGDLEVRPA